MTAINNKNIISNKIVTFLSSSDISVVFIYLFSHANTNLLKRRFLYEQFLISQYSSNLHTLLDLQSHKLGFHIYHLY